MNLTKKIKKTLIQNPKFVFERNSLHRTEFHHGSVKYLIALTKQNLPDNCGQDQDAAFTA